MGNVTAKTSGEIATFMTPAKTNIKSLKVHFSPKQLGTGDPSPENVREIVGWDGVEACQTSINLLDQSYITNASGWVLSSDDGNTMYCGVPVYKGNVNKFYTKFRNGYPFVGNPFKENVQYNVSAWLKTVNGNSLQGLKFGFKYTDGTTSLGGIFSANNIWKRQTVTSKANKTVSGIHCSYNNSGEIYLCGLAVCEKEFDDTSVVYPSAVNNISIDWSNDIETVYGGYIDLISGELVEEYKQVILDSSNTWNTGTNYLYRGGYLPSVGGKNAYVKTLCSHLKNPYDVTTAIAIGKNGNLTVGKNFFDLINIEMTRDAFNQYLETQYNNGTPLQICYLLETPITHQLTPTQLQSFVGQNNFWSNTDYVEVEYDLIETEDIQKCRKKIILNQPHIESVNSNIVNFTTNMKSPLKECKIYFEPVQEGEGDPSPDNVRNITGWNEVSVYHYGENLIPKTFPIKWYLTYPSNDQFVNANSYSTIIIPVPKGIIRVEKSERGYIAYCALCDIEPVIGTIAYKTITMVNRYSYNFDNSDGHKYLALVLSRSIQTDNNWDTFLNINPSVTISSTNVDFTEPIDGMVYPLNWSNEVGTVYGGYLDLVTGELVGTYTYQTFDGDEPWSVYGSDVYRFALQPSNGFPKKKNGQNNVICDSYSAHGYNSNYYVALSGTQALYPTAQDLKDALSQNPIHACYELLEPVHYQLTPQQLLTFKGENNIWSDTNGQTEVKFWIH